MFGGIRLGEGLSVAGVVCRIINDGGVWSGAGLLVSGREYIFDFFFCLTLNP